jgi:hypothetical protein
MNLSDYSFARRERVRVKFPFKVEEVARSAGAVCLYPPLAGVSAQQTGVAPIPLHIP